MYNGPYQTVRQLEERVEEVDDPLESLKVGSMVAVLLSNYRQFPVIGEVLAIDGEKSFKFIIGKELICRIGVLIW